MNQIFRNNIGDKVITPTKKTLGMGFALLFSIITFFLATLSFAGGFAFKSYLDIKQTKLPLIIQSKPQKKTETDENDYEINLGMFNNKIDAKDFTNKISELHAVIAKTSDGYIVKLKDKMKLKHALSAIKTIKEEYNIISTLIERHEQ